MSRLEAAMSALKAGQPVVNPETTDTPDIEQSSTEVESPVPVETQDANANPDQETQEGSETVNESGAGETPPKVADGAKEKILIRAPDGKKQEIEVDWNDKEKLKKYIHAAAGMRQFQHERDRVKQEMKALQEKHKDVESSWNTVQKTYSEKGLKGLVNLLTGREDGYDLYLKQEFEKIQRKQEASPEELRQMDLEERLEQEQKERQKLQREVEESLNKTKQEKEEAKAYELQSKINPAFDRVRFSGKLGDVEAENELDGALWDKALKRLQAYPDDVELTPNIIEKEFRTVAATFRKVINGQADKKTEQVIQQKKQNAATSAAAVASQGYKPAPAKEAMMKSMRSGNMADALRQFLSGGK